MTVEDIYGAGCVNLGKEILRKIQDLLLKWSEFHENFIINY